MVTMSVPVLLALTFAAFDDWPQWRGPNRDAIAQTSIAAWPDKLMAKWKVEVGEGHSSPIFGAGRIYQFARQDGQEVVRAIDPATGKNIWQRNYDAPYSINMAAFTHGKGPKSTPVFANGRLYTFGINGILTAWDAATGNQIWRHDFKNTPAFGGAMSPIVFENMLIAHGGGDGAGFLTAFDATTGAIKWTWKDDGPAYASPVITMFEGTPHLVTESQKNVIGINARTGQFLWKIPFTTSYEQNSVTPAIQKDVVVYSGLDRGVGAVRLTRQRLEPLWENKTVSMYMNSPVWSGDLLCGLSHKNKGQYFCLNATNGQIAWTSPGRQGDNAAMILAGSKLLALNTDGHLLVMDMQAKSFQLLRDYEVASSATWAHPAIVPGGILIKDSKHLIFYPLQ